MLGQGSRSGDDATLPASVANGNSKIFAKTRGYGARVHQGGLVFRKRYEVTIICNGRTILFGTAGSRADYSKRIGSISMGDRWNTKRGSGVAKGRRNLFPSVPRGWLARRRGEIICRGNRGKSESARWFVGPSREPRDFIHGASNERVRVPFARET